MSSNDGNVHCMSTCVVIMRHHAVYELPDMREIESVPCPISVNCCAISRDEKYLCALGDLPQAYLFQRGADGHYTMVC